MYSVFSEISKHYLESLPYCSPEAFIYKIKYLKDLKDFTAFDVFSFGIVYFIIHEEELFEGKPKEYIKEIYEISTVDIIHLFNYDLSEEVLGSKIEMVKNFVNYHPTERNSFIGVYKDFICDE